MALSSETRSQIETLLRQHTVVLFMKGNKQQPRCGFSAKVVEILDGHGVDFRDVDVLSDPALREGIKEFSNWPTIPQLFYQGSLIGGSDIVRQLEESGELLPSLGIDPSKVVHTPPSISISPEAAAAIKDAAKEAEPGQQLRMVLQRGGQSIDLYFDSPRANDLTVEQHGITVLFDRASAKLASGIAIGFVDGPGGGFRIDNPNLPYGPSQLGIFTFAGDLGLRWKHNAWINYATKDFNVTLTQVYRAGYENQKLPGIASGAVTRPDFNARVKPYVIYNLAVAITAFSPDYRINLGVKNLFDTDPPYVFSQYNYDYTNGNPLGRVVEIGLKKRF